MTLIRHAFSFKCLVVRFRMVKNPCSRLSYFEFWVFTSYEGTTTRYCFSDKCWLIVNHPQKCCKFRYSKSYLSLAALQQKPSKCGINGQQGVQKQNHIEIGCKIQQRFVLPYFIQISQEYFSFLIKQSRNQSLRHIYMISYSSK